MNNRLSKKKKSDPLKDLSPLPGVAEGSYSTPILTMEVTSDSDSAPLTLVTVICKHGEHYPCIMFSVSGYIGMPGSFQRGNILHACSGIRMI